MLPKAIEESVSSVRRRFRQMFFQAIFLRLGPFTAFS